MLLACLLAVAGSAGLAGESASLRAAVSRPVAPRAAPLAMADAVRDKNFPFFRTLESQRTRLWLQREPAFAALTLKYRQRLQTAQDACAEVAACYVEAVRWSAADIGKAGDALRTLCSKAVAGCRQIARELRAGGTMIRLQDRSDADLLAEAWALQMGAVMRTLAIYGDGGAPRYRDIDAMAGDPKSAQFVMQLREVAQAILATNPADRLFMADALQFSLRLLAIDGRDEAGRLEPMERGENRAAYRQVARVQWSRFPYSAILVPGGGPDSLEVRLSPKARQRLTAAVTRYRAQAAPFIIVSGGYVHPARTPYCEALEM
jgi:hypothetical protein